jgi:hypothetical protein
MAPAAITAGEFTAGPNPVAKTNNMVGFYRQGRRVEGTLTIYDATGNAIKNINLDDRIIGNQSRRLVGSWDLKDGKARPVSKGTYLVRGVIKTSDGGTEKVSLVIGIR